jgi:hypothetical protein
MGNVRKLWKKTDPSQLAVRKVVGDKNYDTLSPFGAQMEAQYDATKAAEKAADEEASKPVVPLPDEEELARINRRKNSRRGGGRASTVLSSEDRLGP